MDVQMPEMDGFEATQQIREAEASDGAAAPAHRRHDGPRHERGPRALSRTRGWTATSPNPSARRNCRTRSPKSSPATTRPLPWSNDWRQRGEAPAASLATVNRLDGRHRTCRAVIASCCERSCQPRSRNGPSCWTSCAKRSIATIAPRSVGWRTRSRTHFARSGARTLTRSPIVWKPWGPG